MISWIESELISCPHAFFKRHGGVSQGACTSLNFSGSLDSVENIAENRKRALNVVKMPFDEVAYLRQIHSDIVCMAQAGWQEGDALVTREKNRPLAVSGADCYPLLFHDPENHVIGAAHCGWKGTLAKLAAKTIDEMVHLGADRNEVRVVVGPGICKSHYEVSEELIQQFVQAGFSPACYEGRHLDLAACNREVLLNAGIPEIHIELCGNCTYESDFFSHRRDEGQTGRTWSVIMLS